MRNCREKITPGMGRLQLKVRGEKLPNMDLFSKSDPYLCVYIARDNEAEWTTLIGRDCRDTTVLSLVLIMQNAFCGFVALLCCYGFHARKGSIRGALMPYRTSERQEIPPNFVT